MEDLEIRAGVRIPASELLASFVRSRGPGGQHGNKTSTKAELRWSPAGSAALNAAQRDRFLTRYAHRLTQSGELILTSDESRSQRQNLESCLARLRTMVASVLQPPKQRKATRPTTGSRIRKRRAKEKLSQKKQGRASPPHDD